MAKKSPVLLKLEEIGLEQYASALIDDQGYDSMAALEGLTKDQAVEIAEEQDYSFSPLMRDAAPLRAVPPCSRRPPSPGAAPE